MKTSITVNLGIFTAYLIPYSMRKNFVKIFFWIFDDVIRLEFGKGLLVVKYTAARV